MTNSYKILRALNRDLAVRAILVLLFTTIATVSTLDVSGQGSKKYKAALPPYTFDFPRDHASHPDFRTEWWYYTGHLKSAGHSFGFELTFFQVGINPVRRMGGSAWRLHTLFFAHFAITDETGKSFYHTETIGRPTLKMAGAEEDQLHVWIGKWSTELLVDEVTHQLKAESSEASISLKLKPTKPPVIHGHDGVSQKADGEGRASHYYSLTRMKTTGTLTIGGVNHNVEGLSWMDHEFGTNQLTPKQVGWDWFSIQLENDRELMLYVLRRSDGSIEPASSGTIVDDDGSWRHLDLSMYRINTNESWTSPHNGAVYPSSWEISVPSEQLMLEVVPTLADQELVSQSILGITYWEGSVLVRGTDGGLPISGQGYVELTGYIGNIPGF